MSSIFGISLYTGSLRAFRESVHAQVRKGGCVTIATVNPEILLRAKKDPAFADALQRCTYRVVDGFGISLVQFFRQRIRIPRITGRMVVETLYDIAQAEHWSVGIVGGKTGVSAKAAQNLFQMYPDVRTVDLSENNEVQVDSQGTIHIGSEYIESSLKRYAPEVLLLGFGAPKQEYLMTRGIFALKSRAQVGIGGLVDVFAGAVKTPPRLFSSLGLEWLWRVLLQPRRFTRIVNAVMVFTITAFFTKDHG